MGHRLSVCMAVNINLAKALNFGVLIEVLSLHTCLFEVPKPEYGGEGHDPCGMWQGWKLVISHSMKPWQWHVCSIKTNSNPGSPCMPQQCWFWFELARLLYCVLVCALSPCHNMHLLAMSLWNPNLWEQRDLLWQLRLRARLLSRCGRGQAKPTQFTILEKFLQQCEVEMPYWTTTRLCTFQCKSLRPRLPKAIFANVGSSIGVLVLVLACLLVHVGFLGTLSWTT